MVKYILIFVALLVFLISIILIYNARVFVLNKVKRENENNVVSGLKLVGYLLLVLSLFSIYFLNR